MVNEVVPAPVIIVVQVVVVVVIISPYLNSFQGCFDNVTITVRKIYKESFYDGVRGKKFYDVTLIMC